MAASRRSSTKKSTSTGRGRGKGGKRGDDRRWAWLVGSLLVITAVLLGGLTWSRSERGQAALLHLGADALYGTVQARVDSVLVLAVPAHRAGPVTAGQNDDAHDWPLPDQGVDAAVACRVLPVDDGSSWWEIQDRIDGAVRQVGARVLWAERLGRPGRRADAQRPHEDRDLLRVDLGVPGRATHTLVLYRGDTTRPHVRWGGDPAVSAWRQLQALGDGPIVAIVIDDWGYGRNATTRGLLDLDVPLTLAVLPGLPYSRNFALKATDLALPTGHQGQPADAAAEAARRRWAAGSPVSVGLGQEPTPLKARRREIMLHQPMESISYPDTDPGPGAVLMGMTRDEIRTVVEKNLDSLPNVRGVNNHQGSRVTADRATMDAVVDVVRRHGLFYLDSLTSSSSVAFQTAREAGVPAARNRIFLDDDHRNEAQIRERLQSLVRSARAVGAAVGIAHPHPGTLAVLSRELPGLMADGVRFVTMSEYLALTAETP